MVETVLQMCNRELGRIGVTTKMFLRGCIISMIMAMTGVLIFQ